MIFFEKIVKLLMPPEFPEDEVKSLRAKILFGLLTSLITTFLVSFLAVLFVFKNKTFTGGAAGFLALSILASYFLAKNGKVRQASWLLLVLLLIMSTALVLISDRMRSLSITLYISIIVFAVLLLDRREAQLYTGIILSIGLIMVSADVAGWSFPNLFPFPPLSAWFLLLINVFMIFPALLLTLGELNRMVTDGSERLQQLEMMQSALKRSEKKFKAAFNINPVAVVIQDVKDNKYIDVNDTAVSMLGYSRDELIGHTPGELELYASKDESARIRDMIAPGFIREVEFHFRKKTGEIRTGLLWGEVVEVDGEKIAFGEVLDITDRKKIESDLAKMVNELETKNAELERFLYVASHDLKSPLVTIRSYSGYLEKYASEGNLDRFRSDLERIKRASANMGLLLDGLVEFSRIGRVLNPSEDVSFSLLVREVLDGLKNSIEQKKIRVQVDAEDVVLYGDRERLTEVVQNLIQNAIDFIGDQPEPMIVVGSQYLGDDGQPVFYVRDNGMGIPSNYYNNIFGLFNKLDARGPNPGVGLTLAKRIVELHGGLIWVESELGKGSTFYFTMGPKYLLHRRVDIPGVELSFPRGAKWEGSAEAIARGLVQIMSESNERLFVIVDISQSTPTLLNITQAAEFHKHADWLTHRNLAGVFIVSADQAVIVRALELRGSLPNVDLKVFPSLTATLAYVKKQGQIGV